MNTLAESVVTGLASGSLYALLALGLALIYQVSGIVNFAQSALATAGAYAVWSLVNTAGLPFWLALALGLCAIFALAAVVQGWGLRRLRHAPPASTVVVTLGLLIVAEGALGAIWGYGNRVLFLPVSPQPLALGPVILSRLDLVTIVTALVLITGFFGFLRWTTAGMALRAVSQSPQGARLVGVRVERVRLVAWGLSAVLAAVAGVLIAGGALLSPTMADTYLLSAFAGAVIGGLESLPGAAAGALLIGVAQNLVGGYISTQWRDGIVLVGLLAVLLIRPSGLFGPTAQRRV